MHLYMATHIHVSVLNEKQNQTPVIKHSTPGTRGRRDRLAGILQLRNKGTNSKGNTAILPSESISGKLLIAVA